MISTPPAWFRNGNPSNHVKNVSLILIDWGVMGVLGFFGALRGANPLGFAWLKASWFAAGALLPYVVLGAFSIGPYVLVSTLFILASAILLTIAVQAKWLEHLKFLLAGVVCNLGFYFILVAMSTLI